LTAKGKELLVSATDLELGFQQILVADIIKDGSMTISGRKLFEILKESKSKSVQIVEKENNRVYISDGTAQFELACLSADEYPPITEPEGVESVGIESEILSEMINKTVYSVTMEEAGFKLSGVFTEKIMKGEDSFIRMVSTDGHRLSIIDKNVRNLDKLDIGEGVMIPKKGMNELNKLAAEGGIIELGFKQKNCVAKRDRALLVMRLLEAKFPDYNEVIPKKEKYSVKIERLAFLDAMRKMLILSNERYKAVKISLEKNTMELVSTNPDLGEVRENMKIEYQGERIEAGFNPRYFIDTLQVMESDEVILGFIDNTKPCILKGDADEGFLGLIMPMRL
ncbi:DNA polymerase III subunit beta, partial [Thermodesulfobacteriota bacterium]